VIAAYAYLVFCAGVALFQVALISGAPWGEITQGGRVKGVLDRKGRVAAAASIGMIAAMGLAVLSAAGAWPFWPIWTGWVALGVQVLSTFANWMTPSVAERRLWGPITSMMLGLAAYVILS